MTVDSRRAVRALQITAAALSSGYGVMFAVLEKMRDAYGISETMLGLVVATGFFASFAAQIGLGPLADRGYARLMLLAGLALNVVGLSVVAASSTTAGFALGRTIMGLGVGAAYPGIRRSIAMLDPDNVGKNTGTLLSFDVVGFLLGPVIAALLVGPLGIRWPFLIAAGVCFVFLPIAWSIHFAEGSSTTDAPRFALGLLRHRWMQSACAYGVAFFVMIGIFDALWAIRIEDLGGPYVFVTLGIIVFAMPLVILGPRGGAFVERIGPFRTGPIGLLLGAACISMYGLLPIPWMLIAVGVIHATGDGFSASSVPIAVTLTAPPEQLAGAQGLVGGVQVLTGGLAAFGAGAGYDLFGPVATYAAGSAFMVAMVAIGWWRGRPYQHINASTAAVAVHASSTAVTEGITGAHLATTTAQVLPSGP
jgi:predicted MFS family arabinose efflux permease